MTSYRGGNEQSRERVVALLLLLERAFVERNPVTQEVIIRELKIDEYPVTSKNPKKVLAYDGGAVAIRQKFERDKKAIREKGFHIETIELPDGGVGYWIDPSSAYAPVIRFDEDEHRVVAMALRFCGAGRSGAFSAFSELPAGDGGLEYSANYGPILRAVHLRRQVRFEYQSSTKRLRTVEPLLTVQIDGISYLVARVANSDEIKGYRYSRMTSMPEVLSTTFTVDDTTLAAAAAWRPQFQKIPTPIDVVVVTNENYANLLCNQYPQAVKAKKSGGKYEVGVSFDNPNAALRFVLEGADRLRVESPKSLIKELQVWLKSVNTGKGPTLSDITFTAHATSDVLGHTLQLLHAVYNAPDGIRVDELAQRFAMSPDQVRDIMGRLVTMEPMADVHEGAWRYPARIMKHCEDWDNEATDNSTYFADFSDERDEPPALMWSHLFELNVALHEAARVFDEPAIVSAMNKINEVIKGYIHIEHTTHEQNLAEVTSAVRANEQVKILYMSGYSDEAKERTITPREVKELNGHSYVRAFCGTREQWATFRVDRIGAILAKGPVETTPPTDEVTNWLTQIAESGDEVVCIVNPVTRYLFEPLPGAKWATLSDSQHAVQFRVSSPAFLDHLMLLAGPGAFVVTPAYATAGHALAKRIAESL